MSISSVSKELSSIAQRLHELPLSMVNPVALRKSEKGQELVHEYDGVSELVCKNVVACACSVADLFGAATSSSYAITKADGQYTTEYFQRVFGAKKVTPRDYYYKTDVQEIFLKAAEVTFDELSELFLEIKNPFCETVRALSHEETKLLRARFQPFEKLEHCTKSELDELMQIARPFEKVEDIFLHDLPLHRKWWETSHEELRKRVYAYRMMEKLFVDCPLERYNWELYAAKELSGRDIPKGVMIPHKRGYFENKEIVRAGGAYKYLLKSRGDSATTNRILYRGTHDLTSAYDDLREEMGSLGAIATYDETKEYLTNPAKGFVTTGDEKVRAIGMSLGGVHLQYDAIAFGKFSHITTVCSPGIDRNLALLAAHQVTSLDPMEICHITEVQDHVDEFGNARFGYRFPDKHVIEWVHLSAENSSRAVCPNALMKVFALVLKNVWSRHYHLRPVIGRDLRFSRLFNKDQDQRRALAAFLSHIGPDRDGSWERDRKIVGSTILRELGYIQPKFSEFLAYKKENPTASAKSFLLRHKPDDRRLVRVIQQIPVKTIMATMFMMSL